MKDYAQSVIDKLKIKFKDGGESFDSLLIQYAMERFLYRLSCAELKDHFILKGGVLFYIWAEKKFRPTKDLDFLYYGEFDKDKIFHNIKSICAQKHEEDGLLFNGFTIADIKENHEYAGVRITFAAWLKRTRIPMQLDVSTGDKVTPGTSQVEFPRLLNMEIPILEAYPKETVFAEKLEAIVKLDLTTSRMKDIYDLYILISIFGEVFDLVILSNALQVTFKHRETKIPEVPVKIFTDYFYDNEIKLKQWKAFIKKTLDKELELKSAINSISPYINSLLEYIHKNQPGINFEKGGSSIL